MSNISDSKHILMIVDKNYLYRVNYEPNSGVGIENRWIQESVPHKPNNWVATMFVDNLEYELPEWLKELNPKSFDFNFNIDIEKDSGRVQIEDLWRWGEGLPADRKNAVSPVLIRKRMRRVEYVDNMQDPGIWSFPEIQGTNIIFKYNDAPKGLLTMGCGTYEFKLRVSGCSVH